jgi:hypothetical protein
LDQSGEAVREAQDLETAKDSNVALYLKLGFKVVGEWDVPKQDPLKMVPMKYRRPLARQAYWLNVAAFGQLPRSRTGSRISALGGCCLKIRFFVAIPILEAEAGFEKKALRVRQKG